MKQVTMESVKRRIADLERERFGGLAISLQEERELACLRELVAVTEQRDALVADNWNLRDAMRQIITARPGGVYFNKWEPVISKALNEPTAIAAAFSSLRAEGVEMFAAQERAIAARRKSNGMDDCFIKKILETAENAEEFAKELRESKGVQS